MFELRHRSVNGHKVAFRMEGQGQTLLLIHGIAGTWSTWVDAMTGAMTDVVRHDR
jgi:pimeloyl-ACP methyl ester carboxylesterase